MDVEITFLPIKKWCPNVSLPEFKVTNLKRNDKYAAKRTIAIPYLENSQ